MRLSIGATIALPLGVLALACTDHPERPVSAPVAVVTVSAELPTLRPVRLSALDASTVRGIGGRLAVGPNGVIAYLPVRAPDHDRLIEMVDSTGRSIGRIGKRGQGPGELTTPMFFEFLADTSLVVWDMSTGRVTVFGVDDRVILALHPGELQNPVALVGDSLDIHDVRRPEAPYLRRSIHGGNPRSLGAGTGAEFDSLFPVRNIRGTVTRGFLSYAASPIRTAFGHGQRYQILVYDGAGLLLGTAGRSVPPQYPTAEQAVQESLSLLQQPTVSPARRNSLLREYRERPILFFREIRFDDRGRLWALRPDGNQALADIYADAVLIGSIPIDCPGFEGAGVGMGFGWLVLSCRNLEPDAPSDGTLRLFRIEG